jgi:DNA-binding CsgD family transcriptional regulator/tetratricopeptide (TPR) repeat protein
VHAAVATALDRLRPDDVVAAAPHYQGAGELVDRERLLSILVAAGERALTLHADAEASRYLRDAVDRARQLDRTDLVPGLQIGLGGALERCGEVERAAAVWREALAGSTQTQTATVHNRLALLEWERGNIAVAELHLQQVLGSPQLWEDTLEQHFVRLILIARGQEFEQMRTAAEHVRTLAAKSPSPLAQGIGHLCRSFLALLDGDYAAARTAAECCEPFADEVESTVLTWGPYRQISLASLAVGDLGAARTYAALAVRWAHDAGVPQMECSLNVNLAVALVLSADWDAAQDELDRAVALGRGSMSARSLAAALAWRGFLHARRGAVESAQADLAEAAEILPPGVDLHVAGDVLVIQAMVNRMAGVPPGPLPESVPRTAARLPLVLPLLGEARLAAGDRDGTLAVITRLRDIRGSPPLPTAFADRLAGLLAEDPALLRTAEEGFVRLGMPFDAARAALERCELDPEVATVTAAMAVFERLDARPWRDRARQLLRAAGVRPPSGTRDSDAPLSVREMEVVCLVAAGLSNAEIADRLFLSVRTVETHLRNCYARLGLRSRVALARWAGEQPDA